MSAYGDENTGEGETGVTEGSEENGMRFSPELVDERIKVSFDLLHAQTTALTEMMDRLIQSNSAKETTTGSSRGISHQYDSPYSEVPESSRFPTVAPLTTAGFSPDNGQSIKEMANMRKSEAVVIESIEVEERLICLFYLNILNKLLLLPRKHSKYIYARCLTFPCFIKVWLHARMHFACFINTSH